MLIVQRIHFGVGYAEHEEEDGTIVTAFMRCEDSTDTHEWELCSVPISVLKLNPLLLLQFMQLAEACAESCVADVVRHLNLVKE